MSMEDILKVLVNSRQQGNQTRQSSDPMADLIGGLLGSQQQAPTSSPQGAGLGDMMGLLEMFMGGNRSGSMNQSMGASSPLMGLLQPFVVQLAKKLKISPEIAMTVVSLVAYKLLSHHPTSGRDSNSFDLDDMLTQMNSGKINSNVLYQSGMVREVIQRTGMNETDAEKALTTAFSMFGKQIKTGTKPRASSGISRQKAPPASRQPLRSGGARAGKTRK